MYIKSYSAKCISDIHIYMVLMVLVDNITTKRQFEITLKPFWNAIIVLDKK